MADLVHSPDEHGRVSLPSRERLRIPALPDSEPQPRHLRDYLQVLHRYRVLAATCFCVTMGVMILVTLFIPRRYTATTRLQVARRAPIELRLDDSVRREEDADGGGPGAITFVATQVAALQSRDLAERVITTHHLAEKEAFLHPSPAKDGLGAAASRMPSDVQPRGLAAPGRPAAREERSVRESVDPELLDQYVDWLSVTDVRGTDLVDVAFTTPSPSLSAFLSAAHTRAFIEANDDARRGTDAVAETFLERQLQESRERVEEAEAALARFSTEHPSIAVDREQKIAGTRLADLSKLVTEAEVARATLESRYEFLTRPDSDPLAYLLDLPAVQKLRLNLLDVRAQLTGLRQRLGSEHPQLKDLTQLEAEITRQLNAEVRQGVAAVRAQYNDARLREDELRRKLASQEDKEVGGRGLGTRYDLLKRDVDTAHELYASLLKQRMETGVSSELSASNVRIIERAEVPQRPSRPKIPVNLALGLVGGLVIAVGAAFGCDYFDRTVRSSEEVEDLLGLPTLATIPNFTLGRCAGDQPPGVRLPSQASGNGRSELLVLREPWSRVAEAFRAMRTALLFSGPGPQPRVIVVTSARQGEGKTVASLNLGSALAEFGPHTLVIDADLRHPRCQAVLGIECERGLSTWLTGQADIASLIHPLAAGLWFLPAGLPPANPARLLGSARMRVAIDALRKQFDFVVIDTPPVLPVTDAVVLAREADGVLLVVKGRETPREMLRMARDRLVQAGASFLGVMVNNVGPGWGDPYWFDAYRPYQKPTGTEEKPA